MLRNLWRLAVAGLLAVGMGSCGSRNSGTCSSLDGTWAGNEIDPYGADRGPVTFIVHGDQLAGNISDYYMDPESYALTAACNDTVTPNQLTGTVTASNQSQAVGRKFYAIYQLDPSTRTGKLSGLKPGSTTFPTAFAAGSGQRLFVFGEAGAGGAGGTSTAATAGAGGGALGGAGGNGGSLGGIVGTVKSSAGTTGTTGGSISTSGGTTGTGGTTAGGGTTGAAGTPGGHSCTPGVSPGTPLISDFSPSGWYPAAGKFGTVGNLTGALFAYAGTGSTMTPGVDTTNQNLVLTGNVSAGDYAGGGMAFDSCVNTSTYTGVQFTLGGTVAGCELYFQIQTFSEQATSNGGGCTSSCYQFPKAMLTSTTGPVTVHFTDLAGGLPATAGDIGKEILGLQWQFQSPAPAGDGGQLGCTGIALTIDDVSFVSN